MTDLSICIPARNEEFLARTIEDILEHSEADTEVIAVLDGAWADPGIPDDKRVTIIYHPESVGQRAATNEAARLARGKWVLKCDAHCSFGQGFDRILLEDCQEHEEWTVVPLMRNLHVFDWVCVSCGNRRYQGPSGICPKCSGQEERDIRWRAKKSPRSTSYCFDPEPHFQYFNSFKKRPEGRGDITETMSLQGSCWMLTRERYFQLNVCDENWGSWGSQGIEVAVKSWCGPDAPNGKPGRVVCDKRTWYSHAFRTQGRDWGFPYPLKRKQVEHAKSCAKSAFFDGEWPGMVRPLSWLVERFWPVDHWTDDEFAELKAKEAAREVVAESDAAVLRDMAGGDSDRPVRGDIDTDYDRQDSVTKVILYYTDNRLDPVIMAACQRQLEKAGLPIVCVSLQPLDFGHNIVVDGKRGPLTMFRQILAGLEAMVADVVFLAEHDVLYHPSHFDFIPERDDLFYYDQNLWKVDANDGKALFHYSNHTSMLCARHSLLLEHYRKRVDRVQHEGFSRSMGYEPGTHRRAERVDDHGCETWMSSVPSIDLRHGHNLTQTRWSKDQFRNQRFTKGWTEADEVPGWGVTKGRMREFLEAI